MKYFNFYLIITMGQIFHTVKNKKKNNYFRNVLHFHWNPLVINHAFEFKTFVIT